ncbi:hypothetical protein O3G_MSEX003265 [Manduca sexta]|uniref:Origin recognition complex subunit 2 n=1 Tax=Manduca sexta TaxID=7130 RepID=A0A921YSZ8_MANSE|nr:hypothetical protein O3G_MSEX003265 [Manduca sexta]
MASGFRLTFPSEQTTPVKEQGNNSPTKRTTRTRNKPKKYDDFLELTPSKQRVQRKNESDESDDAEMDEASPQKPTALFDSNDVEGQDIFKFKSRHTRQDLHNKVQDAISNSPKIMDSPLRTPKKTPSRAFKSHLSKTCEVTPRHVKEVIKKRIIQEVESDSEESDFSGTSSDFVPDESDNETEAESSSEDEIEQQKPSAKLNITRNVGNKMKAKDSDYFVTPDNYFMMNSSKKITTSDHTLSRLKNLNIEENEAQEHELSDEHKLKIGELNQTYQHIFNRWLYALSENFNIILYGIGSKRSILQQFQAQKLKKFPCIVVNGFFPSLTIKNILETIIIDLLENTHVPSNVGDIVNLIDAQLTENGVNLFLIIHNIDGTMLRSTKTQATLASISQIKNVHTIATIDHINAPLLWDHSKLSKFNFTWWDVTTFLPYSEETSYENSIMTHRSGALQLSSLRSVYQSLTANAKGIFNIIIQYQLENVKQAHYQGIVITYKRI